MLALILISLLVIGLTTILFFHNQNEAYHIERLARKEKTVIRSIQYFLKDFQFDDDMSVVHRDFWDKIAEIADVNNVEINIFTTSGEILMGSRADDKDPDFYNQKVDSEIQFLLEETHERQVQELGEERVSTFSYIQNDQGENIAIVNIPYDMKASPNKDSLAPFLTTLIEIYVFLLIGASLIAYFLSNYITKSLRVIADKLKKVKFHKKNEHLQWVGDDEIRALVDQYNEMIGQLEESAGLLAKSERESAWREMAKQVAHEIKNPLTPMKLSVQHLERSLQKDDEDHKEKLKRFSNKMIQQIDTLSSIANEFSNFAKMPKANMESISISDVLRSTIELFGDTEGVKLDFLNKAKGDCGIMGDPEQLTRVFNNLIKNAIQAIPDEKSGHIEVFLIEKPNAYQILVKDNGEGIPEELQGKIFVPNFTTKSTGTGLGLAMVRQIVESHSGSIEFETKLGVGTTFIVDLPKAS